MKSLTKTALIVSILGLGMGLVLAPRVNADSWDQLTKVTFNEPVEIPGQVLPAGTYWFKLLDSQSDRNIVQIFNENRNKLYATILALPDYRLKPTGKTVITFEERAANSPPALRAWFYPGDNYGQEFVYPKTRATQLARVVKRPVPSMPSNLEANTKMPTKSPNEAAPMAMKKAPVKAEQPSGSEVEIGTVVTTPPQLAQNNPQSGSSQTQPSARLPATASALPSVALLGFVFLMAGVFLHAAASRSTAKRSD